MRKWVYTGDGERKVRIVFVGETEPKSLNAESEAQGVAVEGFLFRSGNELGKLLGAQDRFVNLIGVESLPDELYRSAHWDRHDHLHGLGEYRPTDDNVGFQLV